MMFFSSMIVCVPTVESLKEKIMTEAHHKRNIIHPGANKMYQNLKIRYWWSNIKREITGFVSRYLICNQIKARCQKTPRLLCPLGIPQWKNGKISRRILFQDFHRACCYLGDHWPNDKVRSLFTHEDNFYHGHVSQNVWCVNHEVTWGTFSIVSDIDGHFLYRFWATLQKALGTVQF